MTTTPQITITRRMPAPPAEVYAEWLDPDALLEWMCPHPARPTRVQVDPVIGGHYRFDIEDDGAVVVTGRYLQLDPGRLISFTWSCDQWADPNVESIVTVALVPDGDDCILTLTHTLLPTEQVNGHTKGWTAIADQLTDRLAGPR